jgi:hypothetical protein
MDLEDRADVAALKKRKLEAEQNEPQELAKFEAKAVSRPLFLMFVTRADMEMYENPHHAVAGVRELEAERNDGLSSLRLARCTDGTATTHTGSHHLLLQFTAERNQSFAPF